MYERKLGVRISDTMRKKYMINGTDVAKLIIILLKGNVESILYLVTFDTALISCLLHLEFVLN